MERKHSRNAAHVHGWDRCACRCTHFYVAIYRSHLFVNCCIKRYCIYKKCVRVQAFLANGHSNSANSLRDSTTNFLVRARHFALKLDLMILGVLDSCNVEDELDNPRTTMDTKFSILHECFFP